MIVRDGERGGFAVIHGGCDTAARLTGDRKVAGDGRRCRLVSPYSVRSSSWRLLLALFSGMSLLPRPR